MGKIFVKMLFVGMLIVVICQLTSGQLNGNLVRTNRPLSSSFNEIVVDGPFDVFLSSTTMTNPNPMVEVESVSELQSRIIVEIVENHVLSVRIIGVNQIVTKLNIYIHHPLSLRRYTFVGAGNTVTDGNGISNEDNQVFVVDHRGTGNIRMQLNVFNLQYDFSGTGDSLLSGQVRQQAVFNAKGTGEINALNLSSRTASVFATGVGDVQITAIEDLQIESTGISNVKYRLPQGRRPSKVVSTGLGQIIPLA